MVRASRGGIRTPTIYSVDLVEGRFIMEHIKGPTLKQALLNSAEDSKRYGQSIGRIIARLHNTDTIHGDLTTSNILQSGDGLVLIDFGLSYGSNLIEDKAVDLYVLERALQATHPECACDVFTAVLEGYTREAKNCRNILNKLADVQLRGRKRDMIG